MKSLQLLLTICLVAGGCSNGGGGFHGGGTCLPPCSGPTPICDQTTFKCVACAADTDCGPGLLCNKATKTCAPGCSANKGCVPDGGTCDVDAGACRGGCTRDADCTGPKATKCNPASGACVECVPSNDKCPMGQYCTAGFTCAPGCTGNADCQGGGATCCNHKCADLTRDAANCGVCGAACKMAETCCSSACADTGKDLQNCGGCGMICQPANVASATCTGGACGYSQCQNGFGDCDGNKQNGCEVDTGADNLNCGACNKTCGKLSNCTAGQCLTTCNNPFKDCGGQQCVNLQIDSNNCGACNKVCNNGQSCQNGNCVVGLPRVLVVAADATYPTDPPKTLMATGAFASVDLLRADNATPTVAQLQAYDAVLVYSDNAFADATTMGNNLATYWNGGGRVVIATFANVSAYSPAGTFGTPANGYVLINPAAQEQPADSLGVVNEPNSPLMLGVKTFAATAAFRSSGGVINGGIVVAAWKSGKPLIVRGVVKGRNRVDLNLFPPSASNITNRNDFWTGDGAIIMKNALLYK